MSVNETAHSIIHGDREKTYGHPAKNLNVIASFWNVYLAAIPKDKQLTAEDVCIMMSLLKTARLANDPKHLDSQVDTCGYMGLLERIQEADAVDSAKPLNVVGKKQLVQPACSGMLNEDCTYPKCNCVKQTLINP